MSASEGLSDQENGSDDAIGLTRRKLVLAAGLSAGSLAVGALGLNASEAFAATPAGSPGSPKLNVVLILIDDLGWRDVGFNTTGYYETPNIDRLRAQGVYFDNAYATCPVCSPTRASLLTGQYPPRAGITNFLPGESARPYGKLAHPPFLKSLPMDVPTLARTLKKAGYATGMGGKWHLGPNQRDGDKYGFDYVGPTTTGARDWSSLTGEVEKFIHDKKDQPFFFYLPHNLVHTPLQSTAERIDKYTDKANRPEFRTQKIEDPRQNNPIYAAMMEDIDTSVGRIMKSIADAGIADRTVVIFTSDNGGLITPERDRHTTVTDNRPLRGGKGCLYEGGIRVPFVIHWPGTTKAGTTCNVPIATVDFYPTILQITGAADEPAHKLDGESIVPLLTGARSLRRQDIYWHYPHYNIEGGWPAGAIRSGNFKLLENYETGNIELYDLSTDLSESKDISKSNPGKAAELHRKLQAWRRDVNAQMPQPNPKYDPAKEFLLMGAGLPPPGSPLPPQTYVL